ncbi:unnamed protein product, partial [Porites evermanni]
GKCCRIPFKYRGVTFNSCTSADYHRPWCSLDPVYKGRWDNCSKFNLTPLKHDFSVYFKVTLSLYQKHSVFWFIALPVTRTSPTVCPQQTTSGKCCSIPFKYRGVTFNSCTSADYHILWCSLDPVYKGRWGNCSKFNLTELRHDFSLYCKVTLSLYQKHSVFCFIALPVTRTSPTVCPQQTTSGKCCSIPFKYRGVTFNSCTSADYHRPWCSLDPVYKGRWDNCTSGKCCSIPFKYRGVTFNSCTSADYHRPWCSLDPVYKGRWDNCITTTAPTVCPEKTTSGKCCSLPFTYKGVTYNSCTSVNYNRPWCSLDSVYKGRWGNCLCFPKKTSGQCCSIPFKYKQVTFNSCTTADYNRPWCSLDPVYKGRWGICREY